MVVPEKKFAFKIPTSIPLSVGCMFSCSALTAFSGVKAVLPSIEDAIKYKGLLYFLFMKVLYSRCFLKTLNFDVYYLF